MKQLKILLAALLCLSMLCSSGLCESAADGNWYELSGDDTVLTVRLPVEENSGTGWDYEISNPEAFELLTMETVDGAWVASFAGTFEAFGNVTLYLRQTSSRTAAYEIDLFVIENNQLEIVYAGDAVDMQVRTTGDANIRSNPQLDADILGSVDKDTICAYLNEFSTDSRGVDWYRIYIDGISGWISSRYATLETAEYETTVENPTARIVEVTGDMINLRSEPSLKGAILDILSNGDTLTYLNDTETDERGVDWYYVRAGGGAGWVSSRYAQLR